MTLPGVGPQSAVSKIVQGLWDPTDDLFDEATLCNGCPYWNGNYAGFWQIILWADGFLPANQIDCEFGPITVSATGRWQANENLTADGVVGPVTRSTADNCLYEAVPGAGVPDTVYHGASQAN